MSAPAEAPNPPAMTSPHAGPAPARASRLATALSVSLIICIVALVYAGSIGGTFALDDSHTIQSNPWVRSLRNVPRFFTDPTTFSTLSTNVDYRPVLQTTYALSHELSVMGDRASPPSGYHTWAWNVVNVTIHALCAVWIFLLGRRLFGGAPGGALAPLRGVSTRDGDLISLCAAVLFAVHPALSGAVNYVSGRSSTLVAALVLPVLLIYLRALRPGGGMRGSWPLTVLGCTLYALALLTKIEAVALVAVLALAELLFNPHTRAWPISARLVSGSGFGRLLPYAALSVLGVIVWKSMSPLQESATRAGAGITPLVYFSTQLHAWWHYVGQWLAPAEQMLENLQYPRTMWVYDAADGARAIEIRLPEALTLLAAAGWLMVLALLARCLRATPAVALLGLSFFIFLSPHSSVVPLAEMVNEHRPYLPLACVALLSAAGLFLVLRAIGARAAVSLCLLTGILAIPLALLTQQRHAVWRSELALWEDNARKQPEASRVQMNYGLALMQAGRLAEAEDRFRLAARLSPNYAWTHLNLGIALSRRGRIDEARRCMDESVRVDPAAEVPRYWRARFLAEQGELEPALADLREAVRINPGVLAQRAALVEVLVALGREAEAAAERAMVPSARHDELHAEGTRFRLDTGLTDPAAARMQRAAAAVQAEGLEHMAAGRWAQAEERFLAASALRPDWVYPVINLGIALAGAERDKEAEAAFARAGSMDPSNWEVHFYRGRYLAQRARWDEAIAAFSEAERCAAEPTTARAYLCEAFNAADRSSEARRVQARVPGAQREAFNAARAEFRRVVQP